MKNKKKTSTCDVEVCALFAGVLLILCFFLMVFDRKEASIFMPLVIVMGVILNSAAARERYRREKTVSALFFTAVSVVLLLLLVLRLFLRR